MLPEDVNSANLRQPFPESLRLFGDERQAVEARSYFIKNSEKITGGIS